MQAIDPLVLLLPILVAWTIAFIATPCVRAIALRYGIIDAPDGLLKLQRKPVAYLGGLALSSAIFPFYPLAWSCFLFAMLAIGIADDVARCAPGIKFFAQLLVAIGMIAVLGPMTCTGLLGFDLLITLAWIISCMNAFNLVDVMDGLVGTITVIIAATMALLACLGEASALLVPSLVLASAIAAVLFYNYRPAQLYFGDGGSMMVGTAIALLGMQLVRQAGMSSFSSILFLALLTAIPALEVCMLIIIRARLSIPFYQGSRHHFCHLLQQRGLTIGQINLLAGSMTIVFCWLAMLLFMQQQYAPFIALVAVFIAGGWVAMLIPLSLRRQLRFPF